MQEEVKFGERILMVDCADRHSCKICELFLDIIFSVEKDLGQLMDKCKIPGQVVLNFKEGDETLDGIYHVQDRDLLSEMVVIEIFTRQLKIGESTESIEKLKKHLVETFVHELVHNLYSSEKKTLHTAGEIAEDILGHFKV